MGVASHASSKSAISAPKCSFHLGMDIIKDKGSVKQNEKNRGFCQVSVRSHP